MRCRIRRQIAIFYVRGGLRVRILCAVAAAAELCAENVFGFYTTSRAEGGRVEKNPHLNKPAR